MLSLNSFLQEMIPLYFMVFIGLFCRKMNIFNEKSKDTITQLLLNVTLPLIILYSLNATFTYDIVIDMLWLTSMSLFIIFASVIYAAWLRKRAKLPKAQKTVYESLIIFGNQGFIGFAIIYIIFDEPGMMYITIFNVCYLFLIWSYGIYLFTKQKNAVNWKLVFFNPGTLSTSLGVVVLFSPYTWPNFILDTFEMVGKMTIPLSMILIGILLAEMKRSQINMYIKNRYIWKAALFRLCIIPTFLFVFLMFQVPYHLFVVAVLTSAMPSASTVSIYAQKFGGDSSFSSVGVIVTTVLCVITIPLLYYVLLFIQPYYETLFVA